ncbi:phytase [Maricaulis parjimensis]|uniref:phytase n=1 Tax=Maricaulis parjimensis TaxID=144023 RepID=UPI001939AAA1|nr:phytase [Maricaulis parjimensis]
MIPVRSALLTSLVLALTACGPTGLPPRSVHASVETDSVAGTGDAADDPAVWVAPSPGDSLVFGTDKDNGVYAYNMDGSEHAYLPEGRLNNVDVRYGFDLGDRVVDLAGASDRSNIGVAFFFIDPASREVSYAGAVPVAGVAEPYGFCFYRSPRNDALYAFVSDKDPGTFVQLELGWDGAAVTAEEVRRVTLGTIAEGCVADDRTGQIYMNEENVGVWVMGAEPTDPAEPVQIAETDGIHIAADAEGAALIPVGDTSGYLVVSSQSDNTYAVYDLDTHSFVTRLEIAAGDIDAVTHTDGHDISVADLGPLFPGGVWVAQDDENDTGGQNFKFVDLRDVLAEIEAARTEGLEAH